MHEQAERKSDAALTPFRQKINMCFEIRPKLKPVDQKL